MARIRFTAALVSSVSLLALAAAARAQTAPAAPPPAPTDEVVVTAPREEVTARQRQALAPNLINVQSAETIQKYPDFNAAEALGRIPGISISTDTGEGRFVNIRGIDGNLAGATFGGVPLLNTNPGGTYFGGGGRAVEFDTLPTGSIDGIVVFKTTLPDHEAEGLGGSIELTPRSAANISRPFVEGALGWGDEPEHNHTGPFNAELAAGARFGFDGGHLLVEGDGQAAPVRAGWLSNATPFSFVITGSRRDDRRGFDDIEEDYNDPTSDRSYADIQLRRYDYHRRRFGYGGEFDFKPNDDHSYYVRANVAGYKEAVKKNRLTYDDLGDTVDPSNPKGFATTTDISLASTDEQETHRNSVFVVGGTDRFDKVVLDYRASYSRATFYEDKNYGGKFTGPQGLAFAYDNSANNGDTPVLAVDNAMVNALTNFALTCKKGKCSISDATEQDVDEEYAYAGNLLFPVHLVNDSDRIKIGAEARLRDKSSTPSAFTSIVTLPPRRPATSDRRTPTSTGATPTGRRC
jgi:TonB-dependent receptor